MAFVIYRPEGEFWPGEFLRDESCSSRGRSGEMTFEPPADPSRRGGHVSTLVPEICR